MRSTLARTFRTLLAALALLLPRAALAEGWPQFRGGPEQRGIATSELPLELEPAWSVEVPEGTESTAAIAGGKVYVPSLAGQLHAFALADGEALWTYDTDGEEVKSSPLVWGDTVFFGDEYGRFHAVDAVSGKRRWMLETDAAISGSANVFAASGQAGSESKGGADATGACILFGSYDAFLYCVSAADGTVRWKVETEGYVHGTPAITGGNAVSSGCDGQLRLVDAASGEAVKTLPVGSYVAASPAVADGVSYFGTFDNNVVAVDLGTGKVVWSYRHAEREFPFYSSAAVTDRLVILGGRDKIVHALDRKTGEARWTRTARGRIDASPVVVGERVYVADKGGVLMALALADGAVLWQFESGSGFTASPAVAEGHLVIGTEDGVIYGFTGSPGQPDPNPSPPRRPR